MLVCWYSGIIATGIFIFGPIGSFHGVNENENENENKNKNKNEYEYE